MSRKVGRQGDSGGDAGRIVDGDVPAERRVEVGRVINVFIYI